MSVKLGSVWIDNYSDLLVIVKSLEGSYDGKVEVVFNYIVGTGDESVESTNELELFLKTKTELVKSIEGDYSKGFKKGKEFNKDNQNLNYRMGFEDGYESGYRDAYEEMYCPNNERERALQEKAFDEGYDQAVYDLINEGIVYGLSEEYSDEGYSEYKFGDVEDDEEEYCFSKELERVLNGEFELNNKSEDVERKHSHYFKDVRHLDYIDVYQVCKLFPVDDDSGAITHARKKLLVAGGRGAGKDMIKDITEARDTLNRYLQIEGVEK